MDRDRLGELLRKEQAELEARLEKISADVGNRKISKQFDEQAVERENDEVLAGLDVEAREELAAIRKALARLDTEHFDKCEACGKAISDERLEAIPHALKCRYCAT